VDFSFIPIDPMTRIRSFASAAIVASALTAFGATAQRGVAHTAVDLTGKWTFAVVTENGTGTPAVVFKQQGEALNGTYTSSRMGERVIAGSVVKDSIDFVLKGGEVELRFMGHVVDKDNVKGVVDLGGQGGATFTGKRDK
jgi:hypothetical protein